METGDHKWHCTKGIVEQTVTMTTRAVKKDALGLATKRAEKLLEEAVHFLRKETEEGARETAEELKRRKPIDHQWSFTTAMKELHRQRKN